MRKDLASMELYHNSQLPAYRNPTGAVVPGQQVRFALRARNCGSDVSCRLRFWKDRVGEFQIPMERSFSQDGEILFTGSCAISQEPGLCWYYFILSEHGRTVFYGNNPAQLGGEGQQWDGEPPSFQITVYRRAQVPAWYKESIVYQIFPDRFCRDAAWPLRQQAADKGSGWKGASRIIMQNWNDRPFYGKNPKGEVTHWPFFGGTLEGIRQKLLYVKSMGAGAIYLNPVFLASSNHKYDTANYLEIDPAFGTAEDFRRLAKDARRLGIRLILDGVFNHTGADSIYFNYYGNYEKPGACQGGASPYYQWYRFTAFPDEYECWWGVRDLPDIEENNPAYQDFIYKGSDSVIRYWLREGASGWRLDVADELPDNFIAGIRSAIKETDPEGLLMGEVWEDASNKVSYGVQRRYFLGEELDATMNYPVRDSLLDFMLGKCAAEDAAKRLRSLAENYPPENFYGCLNLIGSHDRARILTMMGDAPDDLTGLEKEYYRLPEDKRFLAIQRVKLLSLLQFVLPGVPSIYYGDEAGVEGFEDPYNRGTYPWGHEDEGLLAHYRMLAGLRKQYPFLVSGTFDFSWEGEQVFLCQRTSDSGEESIIAAINRDIFGSASFDLRLPEDTDYVLELLSSEEKAFDESRLSVELPSLSAALYYCGRQRPKTLELPRSAGILCHVSSLPSGRLDDSAEQFIDYLASAGQKVWQILPLNPVDERGNSPYSSPAVFAGNPALCGPARPIDPAAYETFCRDEAFWLDDFALYTVLKERFDGLPWQQWPEPARTRRDLSPWTDESALEWIKGQQFLFWTRWQEVKDYANEKGISIVGDIPLYVDKDSADAWAHPEAFLLDEAGMPLAVAGVPPDYFNKDGQHWGNPLYDWEAMEKDGYRWWTERISCAMKRFDYVRLDHFRSFSAFYAIPPGKTACEGWWLPGVGKKFFEALTEKLGPLPLLVEDLGFLDAQVDNLRKLTGYPGMLVYQFSAEEIKSLSQEQAKRKILYTGTHDNQTLAGWCGDHPDCQMQPNEIIRELYDSPAPWVIVPLQDVLGLGDGCRMNVPGKLKGNWTWKAAASQLSPAAAQSLKGWVSASGR